MNASPEGRRVVVRGTDSGSTTKPDLPPDHIAAMRVPKGGSMCKNCEYLGKDQKTCTADGFIKWQGPNKPAGSNRIPAPIDEYCSDWYEPRD